MEQVDLLVGTTKGLFVLEGAPGREGWRVSGPFCDGWPINHAIGHAATGEIWAAGGNGWTGPGVWRRKDGEWSHSGAGLEGNASVWSLARDGGRMLAGTKPAALWESRDGGVTWAKLPALTDLPGADAWEPGAAGLVLHTILVAPGGRIWVGISSAGAFASKDRGASWQRQMRRSNRPGPAGAFASDPDNPYGASESEVFQCVHNMMLGATDGLIYMQNHLGTYRTRDGGEVWEEIGGAPEEGGLPSTFGFPVGAHPRDPGTVWVFPLNGDTAGRYPPGAKAAVWRSRDGGETWEAKGDGLPGKDCFFTVLRQAMAVDRGTPAGVYFGTNSGSVFASRDEGESWTEIARHLPTVLSVEVMG